MQSINTTDAFKSTIESDKPVIVKFEAGWCPDCKSMDMWIDQSSKNIMTMIGILLTVMNSKM